MPEECRDSEIVDKSCMMALLHPDVVKRTSIMIMEMCEKRRELMYITDEERDPTQLPCWHTQTQTLQTQN